MKKFVVIGLGKFGASISASLFELGCEVLAIDRNKDKVELIMDRVTQAVRLDATDEVAVKQLDLSGFDGAVVAMGENIASSIFVTLLMKEIGLPMIVAKASNNLQAKVLSKVGADRVVFPEKDMGTRIAKSLVFPGILDYLDLSPEYMIVGVRATKDMDGKSLADMDFRNRYGVNVLLVRKGEEINATPRGSDIINVGDFMVIIGKRKQIETFRKEIEE